MMMFYKSSFAMFAAISELLCHFTQQQKQLRRFCHSILFYLVLETYKARAIHEFNANPFLILMSRGEALNASTLKILCTKRTLNTTII
jgi:hypothetical protein